MRSLLGRFHRPFARSVEEQLLLLNNLGDGSTLSLDFTTGVLDPRLTFTRSTTGTFINASGLVASAAINTPRFDYDPTTLQPRGLLMEASAVNLATYSNLQAGWAGAANTTLTPNTTDVLSPDGTNNAAKVALNSTSYCSRFESISGLAASTTYTFSYWIRGTAGNQQRVFSSTASVDLVAQTNLTYSTSGWTRVQITFTTGSTGPVTVFIYVVSRPTGTTSDVMYIWGAQLELGTGASSLIPTGASTGSRGDDLAVMNDISALLYSTTNGTLQYTGSFTQINSASFPTRVGFQTTGGAATTFEIFTNVLSIFAAARGASGNPERSVTISLNSEVRFASAFDAALSTGEVRVSLNGAAVVSSSASGLTATTAPNIFAIGRSGFGAFFPCGTIKAVKYWPTTLSDARLQAITT